MKDCDPCEMRPDPRTELRAMAEHIVMQTVGADSILNPEGLVEHAYQVAELLLARRQQPDPAAPNEEAEDSSSHPALKHLRAARGELKLAAEKLEGLAELDVTYRSVDWHGTQIEKLVDRLEVPF